MKNFKMNKKILALLLTGTIALTTTSCTVKKDNKMANMPQTNEYTTTVTSEPTQEPMVVETPTEVVGTVEIAPTAIKLLNAHDNLVLVRENNHLALIEGDIANTKNENPLYSYEQAEGKGTTTDYVNFRTTPTTDDKENIIETLKRSTNVNVLGRTDNNWFLVEYNGTLGFIRGDYLQIMSYNVDSNYELSENSVSVVPAIQATTNVKIRKEANETSQQLDLLRKDSSIKMLQLLPNGWYEVAYKGGVAYICGDYVRETIMVEGNCYQVVYLKNDAYLYDQPNGNVTDVVSQYESGEVYTAEGDYYLVATGDKKVGYIKKSDVSRLSDTCAIVDISSQTLTVYCDNKIVLTSPIVSGKDNEERHSDIGIFTVRSKEKDTYLTDGATYNSHVDYWMPYNGGEGLHDAQWRSRFGGDIYKNNGSHGCINLPLEKAAELYGIISKGDNVLVKR